MKAKTCPICDGLNGGKWTCGSCTPLVNIHRELLRNLQHWQAMHEAREVPDVLVAADKRSYCLWDVEVFYARRTVLPERQREAIELCLFENLTETTAAERMGVSPTNPVAMYATVGLTRLLCMARAGEIPGYHLDEPPAKEDLVHVDAPAQRSAHPVGGDRGRADQGVVAGGDEALRQGGHPDSVEGAGAPPTGDLRAVRDPGLGQPRGDLPPVDEPDLGTPEQPRRQEDGTGLPTGRSAADRRGELERGRTGHERADVLMGQRVSITMDRRSETDLDLAVRFGPQVRYQCRAETGCRRYFKVSGGRGTCGQCGTHYVQTPETGLFTAAWTPQRESVPA